MQWFFAGIVVGVAVCIAIEKTVKAPDWPIFSSHTASKMKG